MILELIAYVLWFVLGYLLRGIVGVLRSPGPQDNFGAGMDSKPPWFLPKFLSQRIRNWYLKDFPTLPDKPLFVMHTEEGQTVRITSPASDQYVSDCPWDIDNKIPAASRSLRELPGEHQGPRH